LGVYDRLIVENNAESARNILAPERLFRIGIAGDLVSCARVVVLPAALYVIRKPVLDALWFLSKADEKTSSGLSEGVVGGLGCGAPRT
jgi:hypothetical protein